jgi:hypothetical protein
MHTPVRCKRSQLNPTTTTTTTTTHHNLVFALGGAVVEAVVRVESGVELLRAVLA